MPDGVCDDFLLWSCVGLPFDILALNLIKGGLIGGLAFFIGQHSMSFIPSDKSYELHYEGYKTKKKKFVY